MKRGLLLLHADEEVEVANVVALVVESLDLAEGRAEAVDFVEEAELGEHALAGGEEDKTGALVDDNRRAAFEEDEVDPSAREGMRCGEADRAATDDDDSEFAGAHLVVSCIGRWSSLVGNANLDALMWRWYLEENACDKQMVFEIGFEKFPWPYLWQNRKYDRKVCKFHRRARSRLSILRSSEVDCPSGAVACILSRSIPLARWGVWTHPFFSGRCYCFRGSHPSGIPECMYVEGTGNLESSGNIRLIYPSISLSR